jgi:hypothetical protein
MGKKAHRVVAAIIVAFLLCGNALTLAVDTSAPLPIEVITDADNGEIRKIYELPKSTPQSTLPVEDFQRGDVTYECVDVLRTEIAQEDTKPYSERFEAESKSKDDASIAAVIPLTREVETEDGYIGELTLVPDTTSVSVKGYGSSSETKTATRTQTGLYDMDTSVVPKTIVEGGVTLNLINVSWQTVPPSNPNDPELSETYNAVASYSGIVKSSYATGYTVTAQYSGSVTRPRDAVLRYTVIFAVKSSAVATATPTPVITPDLSQTGDATGEGTNQPGNTQPGTATNTSGKTTSSGGLSGGGFIIIICALVALLILGGIAVYFKFVKGYIINGKKSYNDAQDRADASRPTAVASVARSGNANSNPNDRNYPGVGD